MNRYEFLTALHQLVKPRTYLEIGVQTGASLQCAAGHATTLIGVDPDMSNLQYHPDKAILTECASDEFFAAEPDFEVEGHSQLDLVFIDGLHHAEQVWKDVANSVSHGHSNTLYVLDDVLPRNQGEAAREQCPGDWAGDCWKVLDPIGRLADDEPRSFIFTVDTFPTGMAVLHLHPFNGDLMLDMARMMTSFEQEAEVPGYILDRSNAATPDEALEAITKWFAV